MLLYAACLLSYKAVMTLGPMRRSAPQYAADAQASLL